MISENRKKVRSNGMNILIQGTDTLSKSEHKKRKPKKLIVAAKTLLQFREFQSYPYNEILGPVVNENDHCVSIIKIPPRVLVVFF